MTGPGNVAMENHTDFTARLAAVVTRHDLDHQRRVVTGTTPYGEPFKVDLLLRGLPDYPQGLAIVARWQQGSGSADQKLFYVLECIRRTVVPTYIVFGGDGWRESVRECIANRRDGLFLGVLDTDGFSALLATQQGSVA